MTVLNTVLDAIKWLEGDLDKLIRKAPKNTIRVTIYVSGAYSDTNSPTLSMKEKEKTSDDIESVKSVESNSQKQTLFERAVLPHAVHQIAQGLDSQSLGVAGQCCMSPFGDRLLNSSFSLRAGRHGLRCAEYCR